jgi:hypothetical protein
MHSIDNGFSKEKKRDNWRLIQKYIRDINEIYLQKQNKEFAKIENVDLLIENKDNEVLSFLIKLYGELTSRRLTVLDGKKMKTDVDNVNKSFLLKDTGEIELLKRDHDQQDKKLEDLQKSQKTNTTILTQYKNTNVVMKGEMKLISNNVSNLDSKNFKVQIFEPKESESPTKLLRQVKVTNTAPSQENINKLMRSTKEEPQGNNYAQLIMTNDNPNPEADNMSLMKNKNPFELLEEILSKKMQSEYKEDYAKIKFENKFIYDFFKHINLISTELLQYVLNEINNMIEEFFNILSEQVNEYVNLFLIIFEAYINKELTEESKFKILHEAMGNFFLKSLKNKSEEMFFIFRNVFISKIFEAMNNLEYKDRLLYFCQLIYKILDPNENQQVDLFKLVKQNVKNEVTLYAAFSHFHDLMSVYSENLIDACLFYILQGIININPEVRYQSLYMLSKYVNLNINFFYNFEKKIERLSKRETDRENCLLIIKMACMSLKYSYSATTRGRNSVVSLQGVRKNNMNIEDELTLSSSNDIQFCNKIINNIMTRFTGDSLFMLLSILTLSEYLYDNSELNKLFLSCLFQCHESIHRYVFYDEPLDDNINYVLRYTPCRHEPQLAKFKNWNEAQLLKAFDILLQENYAKELTQKDYSFVNFLLKGGIRLPYSETYKNNFRFSKLVINDLKIFDRCHNALNIIEAYLFCEPISKHVFDDIFDDLQAVLKEITDDNRENIKKCKEVIIGVFKNWINNSSSILKEGLKKLSEILHLPANTYYQ